MSDPAALAEQALRDIHALRGDVHAMRPILDGVAGTLGRLEERLGGVVKASDGLAEEIKALKVARELDRAEVAALRLELVATKAAAALPLRAVVAVGAFLLLAVGGVVVNNAMKPPTPQIIVQQPASNAP
jgi:hypothetical protein